MEYRDFYVDKIYIPQNTALFYRQTVKLIDIKSKGRWF